MLKHTPGPWKVRGQRIECDLKVGDIAHIYCKDADNAKEFHSDETAKANARLIAAAPELLEACKTMQAILATLYTNRMLTTKDADKFCEVEKALANVFGE